jgi:surface antigen
MKRLVKSSGQLLAVSLIALSTGACSFSMGLFGMSDDEEPKTTGAIVTAAAATPLSASLNDEDWRRAKAALGVALDPQGPGTHVSWDNPGSGMKGTIVPNGAPFVKNDEVCRGFTAQIAGPAGQHLQGVACRPSGSEWAIKDVKPAKSSRKT